MWDKHVQEVAASVGISDLPAACDAANGSYASFKKSASTAVRERDMQVVHSAASQQTTLARYLPMLGPDVTKFPNTLQPYLEGAATAHTRLKLQFRSSTAAVAHRKELTTRNSRRQQHVSHQCPVCTHTDETCVHLLLDCPYYEELRVQLKDLLSELVGGERVAEWEALSAQERYQTLLSDHFWGQDLCGEVDKLVQQHLWNCWGARMAGIELGDAALDGAGPNGQQATV